MNPIPVIRELIQPLNLDFLLITHLPHIRYISGFTGSNAYLLLGPQTAVLITDGRYIEQSKKEVQNFELVFAAGSNQLSETLHQSQILTPGSTVGFESAYTSVASLEQLKNKFTDTRWQPVVNRIEPLRQKKSPEELRRLCEAIRITEKAFECVLPDIRPGISESRLAARINYQLRLNGASKEAFDTIVASGIHSSMPHARPTDKLLQTGEFVILDFGAVYEGYHGDMTRTVFIGSPTEEERDHYNAVREAQKRAMEAARAGITAKALDAVARDYLKEKLLDSYFTHSLGHGIGLEIHESPILSQTNEQELPEGLVCTIEPGIYIPGRYGIRIENDVCLTNHDCRNLMSLSTELITVHA